MPTKEFREFFLRNTQVNSGAKPDQEVGYPTQYLVGTILKFNRFLKDHYPSEGIMKKFLESITFKLNPEDAATATLQGLGVVAKADEVLGRRNTPVFTNFIRPINLTQVDIKLRAIDTIISFTANTTNLSDVITALVSTENIAVGDPISGTDIPAQSYVTEIINSTSIRISNNATATGFTTVSLTSTINNIKITKAIRALVTGDTREVYIIENTYVTPENGLTVYNIVNTGTTKKLNAPLGVISYTNVPPGDYLVSYHGQIEKENFGTETVELHVEGSIDGAYGFTTSQSRHDSLGAGMYLSITLGISNAKITVSALQTIMVKGSSTDPLAVDPDVKSPSLTLIKI